MRGEEGSGEGKRIGGGGKAGSIPLGGFVGVDGDSCLYSKCENSCH